MDPSLALLAQLFDSLPLGVVVLDAAGKVVIYNRAEERLANRQRARVVGRDFFVEVAPCMNVSRLAGEFRAHIGRRALDVNLEFSFPFMSLDEPRDVRLKMSSFEVGAAPYAVLTVEDISAQRSVERMKETLQDLLIHDLKNPLSAILANLGFLNRVGGIRDNADAVEAISDSVQSARRLQAMLLNLLDISRLETGSLPLARADVDLDALLAAVVEENAALARMHDAALALGPACGLRASVDPAVLRRALGNLIENAVRHAPHVTVAARRDRDALVLEVVDDGPGVPAAMREAIFEKYTQVGSARPATASYNRGLGLTFVRLAAHAHGGDAAVDCPAGSGSAFRITLPAGSG
jgi:photoactive yellow protein